MAASSSSLEYGLPSNIRAQLARIEREYEEGELTQRGYEIRRSRLLSAVDMTNLSLISEGISRVNTNVVMLLYLSIKLCAADGCMCRQVVEKRFLLLQVQENPPVYTVTFQV